MGSISFGTRMRLEFDRVQSANLEPIIAVSGAAMASKAQPMRSNVACYIERRRNPLWVLCELIDNRKKDLAIGI